MVLHNPDSLINSVVISSFSFLVLVWVILHVTLYSQKIKNRLQYSLLLAGILVSWFTVVLVLGRMKFFALNPLLAPNIILGFLALFIVLKFVFYSPTIKAIASKIGMHWLILVQTYRIVGWGFIVLYKGQLLPAAFAFPAGFGDMIVGITAPFVALLYFLKKPYATKLAIAWNILGIADLIVAVSIGILAFPRPLQVLPTAVSTEIFALYPLVIILLFAVPLALLLHLFSFRILRQKD